MAWLILILSGAFEAVWATALARSDGLKRRGPTALFLVAMVVSMIGLGWAMQFIPTGTAYAVWVGIGAALTAVWAMASGQERASIVRIALIAGLVACVVGLKVLS